MTEQPPTRVLANDQVALTFDARTGALLSIRHAQGGELLRARHARHGPFALYHSLHSPYAELGPATSAHRAHTDPADLAQGLFCPGQGARAEFCATFGILRERRDSGGDAGRAFDIHRHG